MISWQRQRKAWKTKIQRQNCMILQLLDPLLSKILCSSWKVRLCFVSRRKTGKLKSKTLPTDFLAHSLDKGSSYCNTLKPDLFFVRSFNDSSHDNSAVANSYKTRKYLRITFEAQWCHAGEVGKKINRKQTGQCDFKMNWWSIQKSRTEWTGVSEVKFLQHLEWSFWPSLSKNYMK